MKKKHPVSPTTKRFLEGTLEVGEDIQPNTSPLEAVYGHWPFSHQYFPGNDGRMLDSDIKF